jgi:hypothetical protein
VYLDFLDEFNSIDHKALWQLRKELNITDVGLLQNLYYTVELPYGR